MELKEFVAQTTTSAKWTKQDIKTAMLHLHDEGEITYRDYFACVLLDPTWLCSKVMGRILSSDVQYQQRKQSFVPSDDARFTVEQIGLLAAVKSARSRHLQGAVGSCWANHCPLLRIPSGDWLG